MPSQSPQFSQPQPGMCFYDRVEQRTENAELRATLLGDLMAHELGHLLLGPRSHSPRGIMCAIWGTQELRNAAQGALLFEPPSPN
jgi:hypothetical protein